MTLLSSTFLRPWGSWPFHKAHTPWASHLLTIMTYVLMSSARNSRTISFCSMSCILVITGHETILELWVDLQQQPKPLGRDETKCTCCPSALRLWLAELMGNPAASPHVPPLAQGSWYSWDQRHLRITGIWRRTGRWPGQARPLLSSGGDWTGGKGTPMRPLCKGGCWEASKCHLWCHEPPG